jgi:hypothetical protein
MRKLISISIAVTALAVAGVAIAHGFDTKSVQAVSATFTATTASNVRTTTCTASNGHTYATTRATYTGTTSGASDPSLNGAITLDTSSLVDTTTGDGTVSGRMRIAATGGDTDAGFSAVLHGGTLAGLAVGHGDSNHSQLIANISGAFTTAGGFTTGNIGGGTAAGYAVELTSGGCKPTPPPKPETIDVNGAVTVTATTIAAAGVTCNIPTNLQSYVAGLNLQNGTRVELKCTSSGGTNTLTSVHADDHHGGGGGGDNEHGKRH